MAKNLFRNRTVAVVAGASILVSLGGVGGAVAGGMVTSSDIKDGTIRAVDIATGAIRGPEVMDDSLGLRDLNQYTNDKIDSKASQDDLTALEEQVAALEDQVNELAGGTWAPANDASSIVDHTTVELTEQADDENVKGTSVETSNADFPVAAGDTVEFDYTLADGAKCESGAPRVFVTVDGVTVNSWDQNIDEGTQCGTDGHVTFTVPDAGRISDAGVVYDNDVPGTVTVSNLTVDGTMIHFQ